MKTVIVMVVTLMMLTYEDCDCDGGDTDDSDV